MNTRTSSVVSFAFVTALFGYGTVGCAAATSPAEDLSEAESGLARNSKKVAPRPPSSDEAATSLNGRIGFGPAKPGSLEEVTRRGRGEEPAASDERVVASGSRTSFGPMARPVPDAIERDGQSKVASDLPRELVPIAPRNELYGGDSRAVSPNAGRTPLTRMKDIPDAPTSCYDAHAAPVLRGVAPTLGRDLCTPDEIRELSALCSGHGTAVSACSSYVEQHPKCGTCVLGPSVEDDAERFSLGVVYPTRHGRVAVNTASCAALMLDLEACVKPLAVQEACLDAACPTCETSDSKASCRAQAAKPEGLCASVMNAECTEAMDQGRASWERKCVGADAQASFVQVSTLFCTR